ncbi:MAG: hypothetical protein PWQ82_1840 [Thermosediminibacterales bacterium]|nr:hypothetical protein [Thermosediminibacterales bacterium]
MYKTLNQRIEELEKRVAELEKVVQPRKFVPEDSDGRYPELVNAKGISNVK